MTHSQSLHANSGRNDSEESKAQLNTLQTGQWHFTIYIYTLEAKGGAKASAPEWESGGQRGRKKHGALFGGRGEESFICGSLPGSSCERRETERRETERRERERGERDERDKKEMREMREMRETVRQ